MKQESFQNIFECRDCGGRICIIITQSNRSSAGKLPDHCPWNSKDKGKWKVKEGVFS